MNNYNKHSFNSAKKRSKKRKQEHDSGGFRCSHCKQFVVINSVMGTANRNHCNWCLWSKHVDCKKGDRKSTCLGGMQPIGLTFKHEGYGKQGEIMLIHLCSVCQKISINRIARDDPETEVLFVFDSSSQPELFVSQKLQATGIDLLSGEDRLEVATQLFGYQS